MCLLSLFLWLFLLLFLSFASVPTKVVAAVVASGVWQQR